MHRSVNNVYGYILFFCIYIYIQQYTLYACENGCVYLCIYLSIPILAVFVWCDCIHLDKIKGTMRKTEMSQSKPPKTGLSRWTLSGERVLRTKKSGHSRGVQSPNASCQLFMLCCCYSDLCRNKSKSRIIEQTNNEHLNKQVNKHVVLNVN